MAELIVDRPGVSFSYNSRGEVGHYGWLACRQDPRQQRPACGARPKKDTERSSLNGFSLPNFDPRVGLRRDKTRQTFSELFKKDPYAYQERVYGALARGRNVVLRAPTGSGKTEAAFFPFLAPPDDRFPKRLLYVAPLRVLLYELGERCAKLAQGRSVSVQTSDRPEDPTFEADATFTTIDQTLSSFLHTPYSLTVGRRNVNAGGVIASFIVLDEFHLLDPDASLPTTFEALRLCRRSTPFLLMTATCSEAFARDLARALDAECVSPTSDELRRMESQQKTRLWSRVDEPLTAEAVLTVHDALPGGRKRSIVVCNTVEKAQAVFARLLELGRTEENALLLHSHFFGADRRATEERLRQVFGQEAAEETDAVLVATQVIEVGLDISCEALHTELAPVTSLIQRAGRCARNRGEQGTVFVYDMERTSDGKRRYGPYRDDLHGGDSVPQLVDRTWDALLSLPRGYIDWETETRLMEAVQGELDSQLLTHVRAANRMSSMQRVVTRGEYGDLRRLIRKDASVTVILHDRPEELESPRAVEGISLYHGTMRSWLDEPHEGLPWFCKVATETPPSPEDQELSGRPPRWQWKELTSKEAVVPGQVIALHPAGVIYDRLGLRRGAPSQPRHSPPSPTARPKWEKYGYRAESYVEHVQRVIAAYETAQARTVETVAARLEPAFWPTGSLDRACRVAIALHDAGKLTRAWQDWAHAWQQAVGRPVPADELLAHTDLDPSQDQLKIGVRRPAHAVEGACAVSPWLRGLLPKQLSQVVFSAIARHHAPSAERFGAFSLHPAAPEVLKEALRRAGLDATSSPPLFEAKAEAKVAASDLLPLELDDSFLAYSVVVRCLRLADWAGTAN